MCGHFLGRVKNDQDGLIPCILKPDGSSKEHRKNWARLIQKIYEVDPLTCPKCLGKMKIISVIDDEDIIKRILKHLSLLDSKPRPPPEPKDDTDIKNNDSYIQEMKSPNLHSCAFPVFSYYRAFV